MPWLPIYANTDDFKPILEWLNQNDELAFIISAGPKRWKATTSTAELPGRRVCLWHIPSGPLPLLGSTPKSPTSSVADPWSGWDELRTGADASVPYFGAGHPGIIWLNVRVVGKWAPDGLGLSSFEWIGNHYSLSGSPAPEVTEKFWLALRRWVKKNAKRIPREGPVDGAHPEIWAFTSAFAAFERSIGRDPNPTP